MYNTPTFRLLTASAILLIISGCSYHPRKSPSTNASKVSYDHSKRKAANNKEYINRYQRAFLKARNSNYPQARARAQLVNFTPQQRQRQEQQRQQRIRAMQLRKLQQLRQQQAQKHHPAQNAWRQVHQDFRFRNYNHKSRVRTYVRAYSRMPERMNELSQRAAPYLPTIMQEVNRRNMPSEMALLPFVESAFNAYAYSPARAAGMWQFIPATARRYGLHVSEHRDDRYNWRLSTSAALSYLQDLNRQFDGDWLLALAAYNCGESRVAREIARNRARGLPTDYWHLNLPRETRNYVPKLLAFKEIYANPKGYGMHIAHIPHNPRFALTQYQPSSRRSVVTPASKARARVITHKVKSGDTLYRIARKYDVSIKKIMRINGLKSSRINTGDKLIIASSSIGKSFG